MPTRVPGLVRQAQIGLNARPPTAETSTMPEPGERSGGSREAWTTAVVVDGWELVRLVLGETTDLPPRVAVARAKALRNPPAVLALAALPGPEELAGLLAAGVDGL